MLYRQRDGGVEQQHRQAVVEKAQQVDRVQPLAEGEQDERVRRHGAAAGVDAQDEGERRQVDAGEDDLGREQVLAAVGKPMQCRVGVDVPGRIAVTVSTSSACRSSTHTSGPVPPRILA